MNINQREYLRKLRPMPEDGSFAEFASKRRQLAWLPHSQSDVMYEVSQLAQVTHERFEKERRDILKRMNKAVRYAKENEMSLSVLKLDMGTLQVIGISDASFVSNADHTSHLGYVCMIGDAS